MIIPGLLTASTSKADHLGMSTDRVACLSMIGAPFAAWFGLVNAGFPFVATFGHGWAPNRYGQFATSRLDESRLLAVCKVSDVLRCPSSWLGVCFSLVLKIRFPPSV